MPQLECRLGLCRVARWVVEASTQCHEKSSLWQMESWLCEKLAMEKREAVPDKTACFRAKRPEGRESASAKLKQKYGSFRLQSEGGSHVPSKIFVIFGNLASRLQANLRSCLFF
jgi:hypothetical protein